MATDSHCRRNRFFPEQRIAFVRGPLVRRGTRFPMTEGRPPDPEDISRSGAPLSLVAWNQPTLRMETIGAVGRVAAIFT